MRKPQIVLDTNVLVSGLRSRRGASYRLLNLIARGKFELNVSVPLVFEYEEVCKRLVPETRLTEQDVDNIIDDICRQANRWRVYYLWRPWLPDAEDDMVLELAVTAGCDYIVTHNCRDFRGADQFGIAVVTPREFLRETGELP